MIAVDTIAELVGTVAAGGTGSVASATRVSAGPDAAAIAALRADLDDALAEVTDGWDRPGGLLSITKGRIASCLRCPASVCGDVSGLAVSDALVLGRIVDTAASLLLVSDTVPGRAPWLGALMTSLRLNEPEIAAHIDALDTHQRDELRARTEERCTRLAELLGDVRAIDGTAQERFRVVLTRSGVVLSGRTDLVMGARHRVIVEVKSGAARQDQIDELALYALLAALRDPEPPAVTAVVVLDPGRIDAHPVTMDLLEAAAVRVVAAAERLVSVDRSIAAGGWPVTTPGPHCHWCGAVDRCPDVSDLALAERMAHRDDGADVESIDPEPW